MSQNEGKFQSKSKKFGAKPGGKSGGKFAGAKGKPGGRSGKPGGFGKRFEGDRPPRRDGEGGEYRAKKPFGDRKPRAEGEYKPRRAEGEYRPRREDGAGRPPRREGEYRPRREGDSEGYRAKKPFGDRPPRRDGEYKPRREGGDRPPRRDGEYRPRREEGEFRPRREGGEYKPRREGGDRPPRRDGEYKPRREGGEFRPRREEGEYKPRRDSGDRRPPRGDDDRKPRRSFEDRGPSAARYGEDKRDRKFGDRKTGYKKPGGRGAYEPKRFDERGDNFDAAPFEASDDTRRKLKSDRPGFGAPSPLFLYGHHAVRAALTNADRKITRIIATESGFENIRAAYDEAIAAGLTLPEAIIAEKEDIDRLLPRDAVHQDVMLDVEPLEDVFLQDLLISSAENAKVIILDQVTDPHNVGAILRSAAFFGAAAVIVQKLHAPEITGTLAKAASGAVEHVPLVREVNLSRAIEQLKEAYFTCIGLDERGKLTMAQASKQVGKNRVAIVMGAEGDGLRRLVAEKCDMLAQLPTDGPLESLNVSNASAIAMYELCRETDAE